MEHHMKLLQKKMEPLQKKKVLQKKQKTVATHKPVIKNERNPKRFERTLSRPSIFPSCRTCLAIKEITQIRCLPRQSHNGRSRPMMRRNLSADGLPLATASAKNVTHTLEIVLVVIDVLIFHWKYVFNRIRGNRNIS